LIASLALTILFQSLMIALFGADIKTVRQGQISVGINVLGGIITKLQIIIIIVSVLLLVLLWLFMKKTKLGKAMRAVADNKEVAQTVGINPEKVYNFTFIIGSAVAGIAAVLIALEQNIEPNMGFTLIIKGFTGSIIGGISSVPGSILGSYLLGLVENFGIWYLPSGYKDAIAFFLLFIFLLFRPQGILGIKKAVAAK
jgi:branched-chain amino acid transport system permease protein